MDPTDECSQDDINPVTQSLPKQPEVIAIYSDSHLSSTEDASISSRTKRGRKRRSRLIFRVFDLALNDDGDCRSRASKNSARALVKPTTAPTCSSSSSESERIRIQKGLGQEQGQTENGYLQEDEPLEEIVTTDISSILKPSCEVATAIVAPNPP